MSLRLVQRNHAVGACLCCMALLSAVGCGNTSSHPTVKVQGKVTYDGKPVPAGTVMFQPAEGVTQTADRPATGAIQPDGSYELSSFAAGDGAMPGEYDVAIVSFSGGPTPEEPNKPEVWTVPKRYSNPASSGLKQKVDDSSDPLVVNFDLKK